MPQKCPLKNGKPCSVVQKFFTGTFFESSLHLRFQTQVKALLHNENLQAWPRKYLVWSFETAKSTHHPHKIDDQHRECYKHAEHGELKQQQRGPRSGAKKDSQNLQPRPPLTGVSRALRARNPERVSKVSPGAFRPRGPKSVRNSLKTVSGVSKQTVSRLRRLFLECFGHVWTLWRLFRDSGRGGPGKLL